MSQPPAGNFTERLCESLQRPTVNFPTLHVNKNQHVYTFDDPAGSVYFIWSGQIKLLMISPDGKEGLLTIHTAGDIFGELCLAGSSLRQETATSMGRVSLTRIPAAAFLMHLADNSLIEGFVKYLVNRVGEQQQVISHLITGDSEHRLGEALLRLARKLGQPELQTTRIKQKITHEELSEMVGTTRPRITAFMRKFRSLGLIETPRRFLIVKERKLADYLAPSRTA